MKWGLSDVVPVKHLTLDDIDTMTNASREFYNKMTAPKPQKSDPMENVMNIVRSLNEEAPVNKVGGGAIAGTAPAGDDPPVNLNRGGNINFGVSEELDELRSISENANKWLLEYQKSQQEEERIGDNKEIIDYSKGEKVNIGEEV